MFYKIYPWICEEVDVFAKTEHELPHDCQICWQGNPFPVCHVDAPPTAEIVRPQLAQQPRWHPPGLLLNDQSGPLQLSEDNSARSIG